MEQLMMWWKKQPVEIPVLPKGFGIRTYRKGDAQGWIEACRDGLDTGSWTQEDFTGRMLNMDGLSADGIFFAVDENGVIAATASGVFKEKERGGLGYVHMVCVRPEYRGKGLGRLLNAAVLCYLSKRCCTDVYLTTDDFRIPAIKVYLSLGFLPVLHHEDMEKRWIKIMERIGMSRLSALTKDGDHAKVLTR